MVFVVLLCLFRCGFVCVDFVCMFIGLLFAVIGFGCVYWLIW